MNTKKVRGKKTMADTNVVLPTKPWYQSKTIRVAVIAIAIGVFQFIQGQIAAGGEVTVLGVVTVLLRLVTSTGLATS